MTEEDDLWDPNCLTVEGGGVVKSTTPYEELMAKVKLSNEYVEKAVKRLKAQTDN
jgi:hypothetical protein